MTNEEFLHRFNRFQKSREIFFSPKINVALHKQYLQFTAQVKYFGIDALAGITSLGIRHVIENIYMDAGIIYGAKIRADFQKAEFRQKNRRPIGFSEDMARQIAAYFQTDILSTSDDITDTTKDLIRRVFTDSYRLGLGIDDLIKQLENTELSKIRARVIARTETVTAANQGAMFVAKDSGLNLNKIWLATNDSRVRNDHRLVNGNTIGLEDYFIVGGFEMKQPGDHGGHDGKPIVAASEIINCRCTTTFHVIK